MALELGSVFMLAPEDLPTVKALPGVTGQLIAKSKFAGWLVACTFPGEPSPGVIAAVTVNTWFDLGRWNVTYVEAIPEIPLPFVKSRAWAMVTCKRLCGLLAGPVGGALLRKSGGAFDGVFGAEHSVHGGLLMGEELAVGHGQTIVEELL